MPVVLARADARQVAVPDETVHLGELDPTPPAVTRTEQTQLDPVGHSLVGRRHAGKQRSECGAVLLRRPISGTNLGLYPQLKTSNISLE